MQAEGASEGNLTTGKTEGAEAQKSRLLERGAEEYAISPAQDAALPETQIDPGRNSLGQTATRENSFIVPNPKLLVNEKEAPGSATTDTAETAAVSYPKASKISVANLLDHVKDKAQKYIPKFSTKFLVAPEVNTEDAGPRPIRRAKMGISFTILAT